MNWVVDEECIQVCIGLFQVILVFTHDLTITIESKYLLELGEKELELYGDKPEHSSQLLCLLGYSITQVFQNTNFILVEFSNRVKLKFPLEESNFESLSIVKQNQQTILLGKSLYE